MELAHYIDGTPLSTDEEIFLASLLHDRWGQHVVLAHASHFGAVDKAFWGGAALVAGHSEQAGGAVRGGADMRLHACGVASIKRAVQSGKLSRYCIKLASQLLA